MIFKKSAENAFIFFDTIFFHRHELSRLKTPILRYFPPFQTYFKGCQGFSSFLCFARQATNADLEYMITGPRKEFITMVFLVAGNIPLMYMLNKVWYGFLMHSVVGQIILAISAVLIFVSTAIVLKLTKPIEYKR